MNQLATFLTGVSVGQPQAYANMKIYPLHAKNGHQRSYRTLDEAMNNKQLEVKEVSEGGSVPTLAVHNTGKLPVLLVVGEELIGAKQNRVLNTSLLVPAETELQIPVSCVERGRWAYTTAEFDTSTSSSHFALRKKQTENVTTQLRVSAKHDAVQSAVWSEVERKISSHGSSSNTRALHDVYDQTESKLKDYLAAFTPLEAEGMLIEINGQVVGGDLFDHTETMRTLWPKLVRSYALDAIERIDKPATVPVTSDTREFLTAVQSAKDETYDGVGLGKEIRVSSDQVSGSGLFWEDRLIHASMFNAKA